MGKVEWFIGGYLLGFFIEPLIEVVVVILKNAWKKYKEQDKVG